MKKTNPALLTTVVLLALLAGAWFGITRQSLHKREALLHEIEQQETSLAALSRTTASATFIDDHSHSSAPPAAIFLAKLSAPGDLNTVLEEIWSLAAGNSLQTRATRPLPEKHVLGFIDQEIELSVTGDAANFQQFLSRVEGMNRLIRVQKMNLTKSADGRQAQVEMTLSLLFQKRANSDD